MLRSILLASMLLFATATAATAQPYPDRPVRVVVGFAAGSGPDIQARTVSQELANNLGQQFYVENRLGANGTIAARSVAQAKPDGYSLLFSSSSIISTPYIYQSLGYDTFADLRPIATIGQLDGLFMLIELKIADQNGARVHRARKSRARLVRIAWRREWPTSCDRGFCQEGRHFVAARALQGCLRGHDGDAER